MLVTDRRPLRHLMQELLQSKEDQGIDAWEVYNVKSEAKTKALVMDSPEGYYERKRRGDHCRIWYFIGQHWLPLRARL